jgi:hypothetical protein
MSDPDECPSCGADFQGEPIPEERRHWYGGATHFRRCVGISDGDSIHTWVCPDCGHHWHMQPAALLAGLAVAIHVDEDGAAWLQGVGMGEWLLMTPGRWVVTARPL